MSSLSGKTEEFKRTSQESTIGEKGNPKGRRSEKGKKGQWKDRKSVANVRFGEIGNVAPRNAALSTDRTRAISEEIDVNFPDRVVLISKTVLGQAGRRLNPLGAPSNNDDCARIIDTSFNAGA